MEERARQGPRGPWGDQGARSPRPRKPLGLVRLMFKVLVAPALGLCLLGSRVGCAGPDGLSQASVSIPYPQSRKTWGAPPASHEPTASAPLANPLPLFTD